MLSASKDGSVIVAVVNQKDPKSPGDRQDFERNARVVAIVDGKLKDIQPEDGRAAYPLAPISPGGKWVCPRTRKGFDVVSTSGQTKPMHVEGEVFPQRVADSGAVQIVLGSSLAVVHIDPQGRQMVLRTESLSLSSMTETDLYYVPVDEPTKVYRRKLSSDKPRPADQEITVKVVTATTITCTGEGKFQVDGADIDAKSLSEACRKAFAGGLVIRLDAEQATFADVAPVLAACEKIGTQIVAGKYGLRIDFPKEKPATDARKVQVLVLKDGSTFVGEEGTKAEPGPMLSVQLTPFVGKKCVVVVRPTADTPWLKATESYRTVQQFGFGKVFFGAIATKEEVALPGTGGATTGPVTGYSHHDTPDTGPSGGGWAAYGHGPRAAFAGNGGNAHHVAFVIDWDPKDSADVLKQRLLTSIAHLQEVQDVQLIFAGPKAPLSAARNLVVATPENKRNVVNFLDKVELKQTGDPVAALARRSTRWPEPTPRKGRVVFLATNRPGIAQADLTNLIKRAKEQNVQIFTYFFGAADDEKAVTLLKKIAGETGGKYKSVSDE